MRQELEVARELLLGSADESATVNPKQKGERRARRRGQVDVEEHVGLIAVALVEERDHITGRVPAKPSAVFAPPTANTRRTSSPPAAG
jgi:hypothetical protein